ncbi:hypothetical protein [Paenibacillus mucilaginosus]|uniref:Uncharacterized protein n=2 Tax=Paenibacillus mucilaginosus TaxID=61624 RepID=I0BI45_9BACL|nr:hypothetical protein [Paenibacillus mucilaginosus]AEI41307.1 conserved hypothetical protein [Paenibacillus mucilaginosus KNP414]AFH62042.1 hypothetical protein B2K_15160 [Paenibacillus mucilaginosus K02]MCG7211272.1 hypothetical protein [Paenibacillus mucilaginosus]WDM30337.1 hypothetical protein KCX80_14825 [Paenibacillus mucilaginosus]
MQKRLSGSDYLYVVTFIFMLVVALGAFFLGLKLGQQKSDAKYEALIVKKNEEEHGFTAYHQQYLVSFYHTIYQPYREFHKSWFEKTDDLQSGSIDPAGMVKELKKLADETYAVLGSKTMPDSSPMLKDAHTDYMRSLKLFSEGLGGLSSKAGSQSHGEFLKSIAGDAYLNEAKNYALKAEKEYYGSIILWNQSVNPQFAAIDVSQNLSLSDWNALPLNTKNDYAAQLMLSGKVFQAFTPQDLTIRIDEMASSGQAKNMGIGQVKQVMDMLVATEAVRPGDFLRGKDKRYGSETLPQLPFFTN